MRVPLSSTSSSSPTALSTKLATKLTIKFGKSIQLRPPVRHCRTALARDEPSRYAEPGRSRASAVLQPDGDRELRMNRHHRESVAVVIPNRDLKSKEEKIDG